MLYHIQLQGMLFKLVRVGKREISFVGKMAQSLERAKRVQTNAMEHNYAVEHQAKLQSKLTIQSSIQSLEKEMRQEIARSLKQSESKLLSLLHMAKHQHQKLKDREISPSQKQKYNQLVKKCQKARWQFLVHRHSCGFTIKNYQMVMQLYPLPSIL